MQIHFDKLILAAGGTAAPVSGSDVSGYNLAKTLGHHLIRPLPALVQLRCEGNYFKALSGVRAQAGLTLYIDHKIAATEEGELQLTDYGISGIPVFQFSRIAARALSEQRQCQVKIDFLPFLDVYKRQLQDRCPNLCGDDDLFSHYAGKNCIQKLWNHRI